MEELSVDAAAVAQKCPLCDEVKLIGRFKVLGMCGGCEKAAAKVLAETGREKAAEAAAAAKAAAGKEKEKEKERVRALWQEALAKEEEEVRVLAWRAERALFHGLPKPVATDTPAYNKWRKWHDVGWAHYVGDKYPVEAEGGKAV